MPVRARARSPPTWTARSTPRERAAGRGAPRRLPACREQETLRARPAGAAARPARARAAPGPRSPGAPRAHRATPARLAPVWLAAAGGRLLVHRPLGPECRALRGLGARPATTPTASARSSCPRRCWTRAIPARSTAWFAEQGTECRSLPASAGGLELVGGRYCPPGGPQVAHVYYGDGRAPASRSTWSRAGPLRAPASRAARRRAAVHLLRTGGHVVGLVSSDDPRASTRSATVAGAADRTMALAVDPLRPALIRFVVLSQWGCSAAGSAREWHSRGHGFDPRQLHQLQKQLRNNGRRPRRRGCPRDRLRPPLRHHRTTGGARRSSEPKILQAFLRWPATL